MRKLKNNSRPSAPRKASKSILMPQPITVYLPYSGQEHTRRTIEQLKQSPLVDRICLLTTGAAAELPEGCERLRGDFSLREPHHADDRGRPTTPYTMLVIHDTTIEFGQFSLERFLSVAELTGSGMVYSDYHDIQKGQRVSHPVIEYQAGSIRDDFNFGSVLFFDTKALKAAAGASRRQGFEYAGLYSLRLAVSRQSSDDPGRRVPLRRRSNRTCASPTRSSSTMWIRRTARCRSRWSTPQPST